MPRHPSTFLSASLPLCAFAFLSVLTSAAKDIDWPTVGADKSGTRYSTLKQINRSNVSSLQLAWTYHTGDAGTGTFTTIECTPIVIGGVMFLTTPNSKVVALDAATGVERWKFDP